MADHNNRDMIIDSTLPCLSFKTEREDDKMKQAEDELLSVIKVENNVIKTEVVSFVML